MTFFKLNICEKKTFVCTSILYIYPRPKTIYSENVKVQAAIAYAYAHKLFIYSHKMSLSACFLTRDERLSALGDPGPGPPD